jgi:hypothetical protein
MRIDFSYFFPFLVGKLKGWSCKSVPATFSYNFHFTIRNSQCTFQLIVRHSSFRFRQIAGSSLSSKTRFPDWGTPWFPQTLQANSTIESVFNCATATSASIFLGVRWDWVHLVRRPLFDLLYQPRMIDDDECEAVGGMRICRGNWSTRRKPAPLTLCPPHIPYDRTRTAAVGSRRLIAWAMVRHYFRHFGFNFAFRRHVEIQWVLDFEKLSTLNSIFNSFNAS